MKRMFLSEGEFPKPRKFEGIVKTYRDGRRPRFRLNSDNPHKAGDAATRTYSAPQLGIQGLGLDEPYQGSPPSPPPRPSSTPNTEQRPESPDTCYQTDAWFTVLQQYTHPLVAAFRRYPIRRPIKIAILDTGIDPRHAAFEDAVITREDFLTPQGDAFDEHGHGTHCAGLLRKVAPAAEIYVARILSGEDTPNPEVLIKALNRASLQGTDKDGIKNWDVDIISLSFGFYARNQAVETSLKEVDARGKIVFAAASNNGTRNKVAFPASMPQIICVFSASGDGIPSSLNPAAEDKNGLWVVGEKVESAWRCGDRGELTPEQRNVTRRQTGTSVATPIAAGILALLLELVYQGPKSDREKDGIFDLEVFQRLETYNGVVCALKLMDADNMGGSRKDYTNVVPWNLLSKEWSRNDVAGHLRIALTRGER